MQKQPFETFFKKMFRIIYEKKSVQGSVFWSFLVNFVKL